MTRDLRALAITIAVAGAVAACSGRDEIFIGEDLSIALLYLSPEGNDGNPGTRDQPWLTFAHAVPRLGPGATLILLDGTYQQTTTGFPDLQCDRTASSGTPDRPITLRADHERGALLLADAASLPLSMSGCSHWVIDGLRAEAGDFSEAPQTAEAGSLFVLGADNHNITLRRLLGRHPNRFRHAHVLRIGDRSSEIVVEECEVYDFHHNAFETARTSSVIFRRNYVNSRARGDLPGGYVSEDPGRGDFGFFLEETRFSISENNIVESVLNGFGVVGRYPGLGSDPPAAGENPIDGNRLLGNIVAQPSGSGITLDSRCLGANPCVDRARTVAGTELTDDVILGGVTGIRSAGAVGTRIDHITVMGARVGVALRRESQNAGVPASSSTSNALAVGFQTAGFQSSDETAWSFDHCATAAGAGPAFVPQDAHVTAPVSVDPGLGDCLVYLPAGSPLRGMGTGARDIGANILYRYENGLLTGIPLWDPATGVFPCGQVVAGVNDDPSQSCIGVHQRLAVASAGCPLPP